MSASENMCVLFICNMSLVDCLYKWNRILCRLNAWYVVLMLCMANYVYTIRISMSERMKELLLHVQ